MPVSLYGSTLCKFQYRVAAWMKSVKFKNSSINGTITVHIVHTLYSVNNQKSLNSIQLSRTAMHLTFLIVVDQC